MARIVLVGLLTCSTLLPALARAEEPISGPKRSHLETDACAQKTIECERACDARGGMDRLSCKTDCKIEESKCRSGKK